jgi:aryl-alcohol dehydrogenase-like predicted oxidoreductase
MNLRPLGRTGMNVSEISFGAWAIGGAWGSVDDAQSLQTLHRAIDLGVNFIDTADVYGDGRSERLVAQLKKERKDTIHIATKLGRRAPAQTVAAYNPAAMEGWIDRSLQNLQTDCIELIQLHCPPTDAYYHPEIFDAMDRFVQKGKLRSYGVSVERVEEALKAIEFPNVQTVQIIFNMFRLRPAEIFFEQAKRRRVGILARVPLASGLLSGKMTPNSQFAADDHRNFNRHGEAFDVGETFSGVDFNTGLEAAEQLKQLVPPGHTLAQLALRWILMFEAVSCAIPGAKRPDQIESNVKAADLPPLSHEYMIRIKDLYDRFVRPQVHHRW